MPPQVIALEELVSWVPIIRHSEWPRLGACLCGGLGRQFHYRISNLYVSKRFYILTILVMYGILIIAPQRHRKGLDEGFLCFCGMLCNLWCERSGMVEEKERGCIQRSNRQLSRGR